MQSLMLSLALVQRTMDGIVQNKLSSSLSFPLSPSRFLSSPRAGVFAAAMALRTHRKI